MISNLLFVVGIVILLISYLRIFVTYFKTRNIIEQGVTGFDIAKEITSNYDEINIVESKKIIFSQYHLKRGIIRLIPQDYEGSNLFSLAVAAQLSAYSLGCLEKNNYFKTFARIIPTIDCLNKSGLITTIICYFTHTIEDAKIGLVLLVLFLLYQYFVLQMNGGSRGYLKGNLNDVSMEEVSKVLDCFYWLHKVSFIVTLIFMLREVVIILGL